MSRSQSRALKGYEGLDPDLSLLSKHEARTVISQLKLFHAVRWRSISQLVVTGGSFVALWICMWLAHDHAYWLTLLLTVPAAGFMVRLFIIQHDCGHGAYFRSRRANDVVGRAIGVITLTPYDYWKQAHAVHHANSGNLDSRGIGDIDTLTTAEYQALSPRRRLAYRIYRHPLILFGVGPIYLFVIKHRLPRELPLIRTGLWRSIMATNLAIAVFVAGLAAQIGPFALIKVHLPLVVLSSAAGVWLFFVQHQFEETYWRRAGQWDFVQAALRGSSYYRLPSVLQWVTGHIGLHHVHHLYSKVPNYRLQECLDQISCLRQVRPLTLLASLKCVRLALWDAKRQKLVGFREAARLSPKPQVSG